MIYSIDTSALIDGWERHYPPDVFPGVWEKLSELAQGGKIVASEEVRVELEKKQDELCKWSDNQNGFFLPSDQDVQSAVSAILSKHPRLVDTRRGRSGADPFVIAVASVNKLAVVTGEGSSNNLAKPKIPDVCDNLSIRCIPLLELLREQGWTFGVQS